MILLKTEIIFLDNYFTFDQPDKLIRPEHDIFAGISI